LKALAPADQASFRSPVPTQMVSNAEFNPLPQNDAQRKVESRIKEMGEKTGKSLGLDLQRFLRTPCGMAAAFVAMNEAYGPRFAVDRDEAKDPGAATARQSRFAKQFVFDGQVHFVRDDYTWDEHVNLARYASDMGWNPALGPSQKITLDLYKFDNFFK